MSDQPLNEAAPIASEYPDYDPIQELHLAELEAKREGEIHSVKSNTVTMADILAAPPRKVQAYIPHLAIGGGLAMLSAPPKEGKSTLLFHALGAMTTGKPFLGEPTNHAKIVYAFEQSEFILKTQLNENPVPSLIGNKDIHIIPLEKNGKLSQIQEDEHGQMFAVRQPFLNWNEQVAYWVSELSNLKAEILVIDTFSAFALLAGGEVNDAGIIVQKLTTLKQAVYAYNCNAAIIINHHLRKIAAGREPDFNDVANSFGMRAVPDSNLLLHNPKLMGRPNVRKLKIEGRFGLVPDRYIELTPEGYVTRENIGQALPERNVDDQHVLFNAHKLNPDLEGMGQKKVAGEIGVSEYQVIQFRKQYPPAARTFGNARDKGTLKDLLPFGYNFGNA